MAVTRGSTTHLLICGTLGAVSCNAARVIIHVGPLGAPCNGGSVRTIIGTNISIVHVPGARATRRMVRMRHRVRGIRRRLNYINHARVVTTLRDALNMIGTCTVTATSGHVVNVTLNTRSCYTGLGARHSPRNVRLLVTHRAVIITTHTTNVSTLSAICSGLGSVRAFHGRIRLVRRLNFSKGSVVGPHRVRVVGRIFAPARGTVSGTLTIVTTVGRTRGGNSNIVTIGNGVISQPIIVHTRHIVSLTLTSNMVGRRSVT